jgi:hypothetical protein
MKTFLTKTESELLLAIITGDFSNMPGDSKRLDTAKSSLIEKGYLRMNGHNIIELNLCPDYYEQRGY